MVSIPIVIVAVSVTLYTWSIGGLERKLTRMSEEDMKKKAHEAYHSLFEIADSDHSKALDPSELLVLLQQLGWRLDVDTVVEVCKSIGVKNNRRGVAMMSEAFFMGAMHKGTLQAALRSRQMGGGGGGGGRRVRRNSTAHVSSNSLKDTVKLVRWSMRGHIVSSSLSGAMQLLLLAHTPVSRKVFQFFHCRDVGGKRLLRADYNVECWSPEYAAFSPLVFAILAGFTVALPAALSFYIVRHRNHLYSTSVQEKIGWLYAPFVRGAEWWQIHDVLMKMVLTGLLIYVPPASRAGMATILSMVAIANLNYFHPHKNKVLFWLTQLSFMTTGAKYVMALLLSAGTVEDGEGSYCEQFTSETLCQRAGLDECSWTSNGVCTSPLIGNILITLDVAFMVCSLLAIPIVWFVLKARFDAMSQEHGAAEGRLSGGVEVHPAPAGASASVTASASVAASASTMGDGTIVRKTNVDECAAGMSALVEAHQGEAGGEAKDGDGKEKTVLMSKGAGSKRPPELVIAANARAHHMPAPMTARRLTDQLAASAAQGRHMDL